MKLLQLVALWTATVALVVIAVFTTLNYLAAEEEAALDAATPEGLTDAQIVWCYRNDYESYITGPGTVFPDYEPDAVNYAAEALGLPGFIEGRTFDGKLYKTFTAVLEAFRESAGYDRACRAAFEVRDAPAYDKVDILDD